MMVGLLCLRSALAVQRRSGVKPLYLYCSQTKTNVLVHVLIAFAGGEVECGSGS